MNQQPEIPPDKLIEEPYSFSKDKIGRELGYPLKRSLLDSALHSASVYATVYSVRYLGRRNSDVVLDASFTPEWKGHPTVRGRCLITVWAVPAHSATRRSSYWWRRVCQSSADGWQRLEAKGTLGAALSTCSTSKLRTAGCAPLSSSNQ